MQYRLEVFSRAREPLISELRRVCQVSYVVERVRHEVQVDADSLYEAVAKAVHHFRAGLRHGESARAWLRVRCADLAGTSGQLSLGLLGMQERAHLIGGMLKITGSEGVGTTVRVRVPTSEVNQ